VIGLLLLVGVVQVIVMLFDFMVVAVMVGVVGIVVGVCGTTVGVGMVVEFLLGDKVFIE